MLHVNKGPDVVLVVILITSLTVEFHICKNKFDICDCKCAI